MSIAARALVAVLLMIGFYLLAVAMAAGLLWIPYAEMVYAHRLHIKLAAACVIGALAILWSILPRPDRFEAPGPQLEGKRHPALFRLIHEVGRATGQALPKEVFLVGDVNAWVAQRGGLMGFGSRRVMGLGLPLLRVLRVSELRAVLAHEFGHYHGGDTRLGPWVYKTRAAIGRTLGGLGDTVLQWPFRAYDNLFLRVTQAISRQQERKADELAARTCGARALGEGLRKIHAAAPAFQAYFQQEVEPVLDDGRRPPLAEGFGRFLNAPRIARLVEEGLREEEKGGKADPYDTHPSLAERLEALRSLPPGAVPADDPAALSLLSDLPALEGELLAHLGDAEAAARLKPVAWEEIETAVLLPGWEKTAAEHRALLANLRVEDLPGRMVGLDALAAKLKLPEGAPDEFRRGYAQHVLGTALVTALARAGFTVHGQPGEEVACLRGETRVEPFAVLTRLAKGELSAGGWAEDCGRAGIAGLALSPPAAP